MTSSETLTWKSGDWIGREAGNDVAGLLTFNNWNSKATYADGRLTLSFAQKGFWNTTILVKLSQTIIGEVTRPFSGKTTLRFVTGEQYNLVSNFWGTKVRWTNGDGETLVEYHQATMSSMGKGTIVFDETLSPETRTVLAVTGVFMRQLVSKTAALIT